MTNEAANVQRSTSNVQLPESAMWKIGALLLTAFQAEDAEEETGEHGLAAEGE